MIWDDERLCDVVVRLTCIQTNHSETMQTRQHIIQCNSDVDEAEKTDDVVDETRLQVADEIDETHKMVVLLFQQRVLLDTTVEIEQNENLAQEMDESAEVVVDDDEFARETDETVETDTAEALLIPIQWTDEIDETDETVESGENDETVEGTVLDMRLECDETDEMVIFDETDEVLYDDVIVCRADVRETDESESFNDELVDIVRKQCERDDETDEAQSIICIDSDYTPVKYTTMWFVRNDETDELVVVIQCRVHTRTDDETDEIERTDEKCSYDISEVSNSEQSTFLDEVVERDEWRADEVATIDVREQLEVIDVLWYVKLCNLFHKNKKKWRMLDV